MSETADQISNGLTVATGVANAIIAAVPAAAPYGVAIDLVLSLAQKVAPPLYDELATLVARIQGGYTPTDADIASLRGMVAQLKSPDSYFHESLAEIKALIQTTSTQTHAAIAAQPAAVIDALKTAMDNEEPGSTTDVHPDLFSSEKVTDPAPAAVAPSPLVNPLGHVSPMA